MSATKLKLWPEMVAHICNPSTLGGHRGWITSGQEFKTSLANTVKPHVYKKKEKKITLESFLHLTQTHHQIPSLPLNYCKPIHSLYLLYNPYPIVIIFSCLR